MEVRAHGHEDQMPTSGQEEEEEEDVRTSHHHRHPPEKIKSVLKKVKDKAKKIKNTLTKHGHDHDSSKVEEEEDDDKDDCDYYEEEDHGDVKIPHQMEKQSDREGEKNGDGEIKVPKLTRESVVKDDPLMTLEEDPNSRKSTLLPSNYQSRVTDSTETGGGGSHDQFSPELSPKPDNPTNTTAASAPSYLTKISSAASTFSDKAIAAKDAVASKLGYSGGEGESGQKKLTAFMSEKMSPREEDKALSETISDSLDWRKKTAGKEEGTKEKEKVMGEVIVSNELAKRLGSCHDYKNGSSSSSSEAEGQLPGVSETMVERIKETVGSWLGLRSGADQSQASLGTTTTNMASGGDGNVGGPEEARRE